MTVADPPFFLRSVDENWTHTRWELLPGDGNRYEVVDGILYMTTCPRTFHAWVVGRLLEYIGLASETKAEMYAFPGPLGVVLSDTNVVQPDLILIDQTRTDAFIDGRVHGAPDLVAEVISPEWAILDTHIKRRAYARAGVREYCIVRSGKREMLVCTLPDADLEDFTCVRRFGADDDYESTVVPISWPVAALFDGSPTTEP